MNCDVLGCGNEAYFFERGDQFCSKHWKQKQKGRPLELKKLQWSDMNALLRYSK